MPFIQRWDVYFIKKKILIADAFFSGVGFCAVLVSFYVSFYYNVILGKYFTENLKSYLLTGMLV